MADSSRHKAYFVEEPEYGETPEPGTFNTLRHSTFSLGLTKEANLSEEIRGDRQIISQRHGNKQVGGDITSELCYGSFDDLMAAALCGGWTTNVLKAGVVQRSFSVLRDFPDIGGSAFRYHLFTGVQVNTMAVTIASGANATVTFGTIGKGLTTSVTTPSGAILAPADETLPFVGFAGTLLEGGSPLALVTELTFTIENGQEARFVVGSAETRQPSNGRSNVTGQITAYFETEELLDKFLNETESSLSMELVDPEGNSLEFEFPRIVYNGGQPDISGAGSIMLTLPFQALYDSTAQSNIVITRTPDM